MCSHLHHICITPPHTSTFYFSCHGTRAVSDDTNIDYRTGHKLKFRLKNKHYSKRGEVVRGKCGVSMVMDADENAICRLELLNPSLCLGPHSTSHARHLIKRHEA